MGRQRAYNGSIVLGWARSLSWEQNWELDKKEVQPSSGKLPRCAACWRLPSRGCALEREKGTLPRFWQVQESAAVRHLGSKPKCIGPCSQTVRRGGRSSDHIQHKGSFGLVDKEEPALSQFCTIKNTCLQVPAYSACSLSEYIFVLTSYTCFPACICTAAVREKFGQFSIVL